MTTFAHLPLAQITASLTNPRKTFDQDKIELGQLVLDFLRGRAKVEWWGIDKKTEAGHTYVAGGDGGDGDDDASGGVAQ